MESLQTVYLSLIKRTLGPSLDEPQFGYLAEWRIEKTTDGESFKIVLHHGEKFHRDRRSRLSKKQPSNGLAEPHVDTGTLNGSPARTEKQHQPRHASGNSAKLEPAINENVLAELVKPGITETHERKLLGSVSLGQPVIDQLEWGDLQVRQSGGKINNPAGFYVSLVSANVIPPPTFETSRQRNAREAEERRREDERRGQEELETEYEWYRNSEVDRYIASLDPAELTAVLEAKRQEFREKYTSLSRETVDVFAEQDTKRELGKRAMLMTLEEFKAGRAEPNLFLKPVSGTAAAEATAPTDREPAGSPLQEVATGEQIVSTSIVPRASAGDSGEPIQLPPAGAAPPAVPEAASEPVAEPPELPPAEAGDMGGEIPPEMISSPS